MRISVVISTYEAGGAGADLLRRGLDSLAAQSEPPYEVVVSDHSRDNAVRDCCLTFAYRLPIRYHRYEEMRGSSSANTNNAIAKASGDIIKVLFMDDYLLPDALRLIRCAFETGAAAWLVSDYIHTRENVVYTNRHVPSWNPAMALGVNTFGCPSGLAFRAFVSERFDVALRWLMDCEFYERLRRIYGDPIYLHEITAVIYLHDAQVTHTISEDLMNAERAYVARKLFGGQKPALRSKDDRKDSPVEAPHGSDKGARVECETRCE